MHAAVLFIRSYLFSFCTNANADLSLVAHSLHRILSSYLNAIILRKRLQIRIFARIDIIIISVRHFLYKYFSSYLSKSLYHILTCFSTCPHSSNKPILLSKIFQISLSHELFNRFRLVL